MRFRLSILTLFRSPMKTLVTFVLLLATSFAFVSRGAEYATTVAEINKAEAAYTAVGTLQRSTEGYYAYMEERLGEHAYELEDGNYIHRLSNATIPIDSDVVNLVLSSPYIRDSEFTLTAGGTTSDELLNVLEQPLYDVADYSEWRWYDLRGTFAVQDAWITYTERHGHFKNFNGSVTDVIVGEYPELWDDGMWRAIAFGDIKKVDESKNEVFVNGHTYLLAVWYQKEYDIHYINSYVDYPIINLTYLEEEFGITDYRVALADPDKYGLVKYENKYGLPTMPVQEYMERLERNFRTQELVHVSDMSKLHKYHNEELYIVDGRAIEPTDTENVCVVSAEYAKQNGLSVGDVIEFDVCADNLMNSGKVFAREPQYHTVRGGVGSVRNRPGHTEPAVIVPTASEYRLTHYELPNVVRSYEIVGLWGDHKYEVSDPFSYSPNTVFVPASTYPWQGEVEPTMLPSTFSFTLNHPGDMAKIEAELGDQLAALGYELSINDMGYAEAKPSFEFMKLSALIGFVAMSAALLLSLILTTYLYIIRKKHDFAIMRALGTTRSRSNRSLLVGLFALAIPAVFLGCLLALALTQGFAADLSAQISEITGNATASSMPAWLVGAFGAGVLALLLVFARAGLARVGRTPPLALLQGR